MKTQMLAIRAIAEMLHAARTTRDRVICPQGLEGAADCLIHAVPFSRALFRSARIVSLAVWANQAPAAEPTKAAGRPVNTIPGAHTTAKRTARAICIRNESLGS